MDRQPSARISARELEVLEAMAEDGATNAEVAARLFISVRTVESHVASLLRKSGAPDRRALVRAAPGLLGTHEVAPRLPVPLTSFIGRDRERALVVAALSEARLVTVVGSGGCGKTRLALGVLDEVAGGYPDPPAEVDLVPVADAALVPSAIVRRLGLAERDSAEAALAARFRTRRGLVLLDNCEHLGTPLTHVLERLLAACPGLTLLATSRTRLVAPFETVVRLGGLPPEAAVELFAQRAAAAGALLDEGDRRQAEPLCRMLDGLPLAIELAAAHVPAIGLDGIEAALTDPLALLVGGGRADVRHGSVRAALEWSHDLLGPAERALLRRLAVLAVPFTADVADAVAADWAPVPASAVPLLGALVDASLVGMDRDPRGTRYRLHEVIRRFSAERAEEAGEIVGAESRLQRWCVDRLATIEASMGVPSPSFDIEVALTRSVVEAAAARGSGPDDDAAVLSRRLASLLFSQGVPADAQRLFEVAATLTAAPLQAGADLDAAAGAAEARGAGDASVALRLASAAALETAGAPARAAVQVARAAELMNRDPGFFGTLPEEGAADALIAVARGLAGDDPRAAVRILTAAAFAEPSDDASSIAREAAVLARRLGDVVGESAALDAQSGRELAAGRVDRAYALDLQRIALLAPTRGSAAIGFEYQDALQTGGSCAVAIGDLPTAHRFALEVEALPLLATERHLAVALTMVVDTVRGDLDAVIARGGTFLASWERAGRPTVSALSSAALAAGIASALAGDDHAASRWRAIADELFGPRVRLIDLETATFDLLDLLHRGDREGALRRAWSPPDVRGPIPVAQWVAALWRPWYAALWAEAAVLADAPDAASRIGIARPLVSVNPVAAAMVERAAALLEGDGARLQAIAGRLDGLDAPYQAARTRILTGSTDAALGSRDMAVLGAAPMVGSERAVLRPPGARPSDGSGSR